MFEDYSIQLVAWGSGSLTVLPVLSDSLVDSQLQRVGKVVPLMEAEFRRDCVGKLGLCFDS